ncbi:Hypothetical predicted protein, partial [Paramuricea clavata]
MAKASFLGVVSFGRFAPDWGSAALTHTNEKVRFATLKLKNKVPGICLRGLKLLLECDESETSEMLKGILWCSFVKLRLYLKNGTSVN